MNGECRPAKSDRAHACMQTRWHRRATRSHVHADVTVGFNDSLFPHTLSTRDETIVSTHISPEISRHLDSQSNRESTTVHTLYPECLLAGASSRDAEKPSKMCTVPLTGTTLNRQAKARAVSREIFVCTKQMNTSRELMSGEKICQLARE